MLQHSKLADTSQTSILIHSSVLTKYNIIKLAKKSKFKICYANKTVTMSMRSKNWYLHFLPIQALTTSWMPQCSWDLSSFVVLLQFISSYTSLCKVYWIPYLIFTDWIILQVSNTSGILNQR